MKEDQKELDGSIQEVMVQFSASYVPCADRES